MTTRHKFLYMIWSLVTAVSMKNSNLRQEYSAYVSRCWMGGMSAFERREWLHRRWFPNKYRYESTCPKCGYSPLSSMGGLCFNCGERYDIRSRPARPL